MNFVDKQHRPGLLFERRDDPLQAFLKITPVFGPGQQGAEVEGIDHAAREHLRGLALHDHPGQTFRDRGLAHPGLAHEQRVILAPATEDLDSALHLGLAANQRVDPALPGGFIQIHGIGLERVVAGLIPAPVVLGRVTFRLALAVFIDLGDAVRDKIHRVQPGHVLPAEEIGRMGFPFAIDGDQHIRARDLLFARRLHMKHGPLQDPLKAERRLRVAVRAGRKQRGVFLDKLDQVAVQAVQIRAAGLEHPERCRIIQQRQQQMLDRHKFMALFARLAEGVIERVFQFLIKHGRYLFWGPRPSPSCTAGDVCWRARNY